MASGLLGKAALVAATGTSIYTVPAGVIATTNINILNRGPGLATVRVSVGSAVPDTADYLEYDVIITENGVLERSGIVMNEAEQLVVRASTGTVTVRAYGFEEVL